MGNTTVKRHPHTGEIIKPLWIRPDGRAMWPILGASPDDLPSDPPADPPPSDPPAGDPPPADDGKGGKEAILADLAKERDKRQALEDQVSTLTAAQQEQMDAIAKALGLKQDDTPPDPAALTEQIAAEQAKTQAAAVQLAVYKNASAHEANADELLDSASFLASLKDVDPNDATAIRAAIKTAVDGNAKFKATQPPTTPPFPGGPRTPAPSGAGSMGEAIANRIASQRR